MRLTGGATITTGAEETMISAHATTTTRGPICQGAVTTTGSRETLTGAEAAAVEVVALALFVGQRGIKPNNAPRHKHKCYSSGDIIKPIPNRSSHHQ